jgi:hypothetical protein
MYKEVFHLTMSFKVFSHLHLIVKNFLLQFQKSLRRGTPALAMAS